MNNLSLVGVDLAEVSFAFRKNSVTQVTLAYPVISGPNCVQGIHPKFGTESNGTYDVNAHSENEVQIICNDKAITLPIGHFTIAKTFPIQEMKVRLHKNKLHLGPVFLQEVEDKPSCIHFAEKVAAAKGMTGSLILNALSVCTLAGKQYFAVDVSKTRIRLKSGEQAAVLFAPVSCFAIESYELDLALI